MFIKIMQQGTLVCEVEDSNIVDVKLEASLRTNTHPPIIVQLSSSAARRNTWLRRKDVKKLTVTGRFGERSGLAFILE
jgi:3-deoxy-D-arabino-heptulosonate 7-phosphate (DAHP) synthase